MEQAMLWVTVAIGIIVPFVVWLFNSLITAKIDKLDKEHDETKKETEILKNGITERTKEGFQTVFNRFDDHKDYVEKTFVRQKEYEIAREYQEKQTDLKIVSLLTTINTQIQGVENKIENTSKNTDNQIKDVKDMIRDIKEDLKKGD